jgi:predicted AlkP superfamily phosphohydrolase/phosphomutase/tetratricopeptide (TPR) repeat protein
VFLIGIDGADPNILDRLVEEGRLPTFARLMRNGAHGALRSGEPLLSPLVWTTIVTGRRPQDHGVLDFIEIVDGRPTPITSQRRRVPALWNVALEFGVPSGFVGWYASYPAERTLGFEVSDRMAFHQVKSARAITGATYPEDLAAQLRSSLGEPTPDLESARHRFLSDPGVTLSKDGQKRLGELAKIEATTEFYRKALPDLARGHDLPLLGVYFELIDACGHLFMEDAAPRLREVSAEDFAAFSGTVDRCYEYQDSVLAGLLPLANSQTTTLVVSDHGFKFGDLRPRTSGRADVGLAPLWHRLNGILIADGRGVRAGAQTTDASIMDIAPTVLALLGLPLSKELSGRPIESLFASGSLGKARSVQRYAPAAPVVAPAVPEVDSEAVERLRALGYLGEGASASSVLPHNADARSPGSYLNEGLARSADGDPKGALAAFEKAIELHPQNVNAMVSAAHAHVEMGEISQAFQLADRAISIDPSNLSAQLQKAALDIRTGRLNEASTGLAAAERIDDRVAILHLLKAHFHAASGSDPLAVQDIDQAAQLSDEPRQLTEILVLRVEVCSRLGRIKDAQAALTRAETLAGKPLLISRGDIAMARRDFSNAADFYSTARETGTSDSVLDRKLGEASAGARRNSEAEAAFRRAIEEARTDTEREGVYGDLSLLLQQVGRAADVPTLLEEATRQMPGSAAAWGLLGAAYGRAGRAEAALRAYERSVALRPTPLACKTLAALVLDQKKDRARAVALWRQSLALAPEQSDVQGFLRTYDKR